MALPPSGQSRRRGGRDSTLDSALAKNCFKPKMICEAALPGVLDIDLELSLMEARGDEKCQVEIPAKPLVGLLARRAISMILRGETCRHPNNGQICCSTGPSFNTRNI